jgi:small neutral amino acid transporter SnatA (MarC family)
VVGVEGIMDAYSKALRRVTLSGPTLFGPVINTAAQMAAESLSSYNSTKYYVLLIITVRMRIDWVILSSSPLGAH